MEITMQSECIGVTGGLKTQKEQNEQT